MSSSEKLKALLQMKEDLCNSKVKKLKKKMKMIKYLSITISILTISSMTVLATTSFIMVLPSIAVSIISIISAILIGIDNKFKFQDKAYEKRELLDKINKIHTKLEYVNSCNGDLTEDEYLQIFKEFNTVL